MKAARLPTGPQQKSLCLDVTHPQGKEVFLKLVAHSDIVTDNFRPGTMQRLGLDHDSLARVKPDIITLSCTAYGHTVPGVPMGPAPARWMPCVASRRSRAMKAAPTRQQQLWDHSVA